MLKKREEERKKKERTPVMLRADKIQSGEITGLLLYHNFSELPFPLLIHRMYPAARIRAGVDNIILFCPSNMMLSVVGCAFN